MEKPNSPSSQDSLDPVPALAGMAVLLVGALIQKLVLGLGITIFEEILFFLLGMECVHLFRSARGNQQSGSH